MSWKMNSDTVSGRWTLPVTKAVRKIYLSQSAIQFQFLIRIRIGFFVVFTVMCVYTYVYFVFKVMCVYNMCDFFVCLL